MSEGLVRERALKVVVFSGGRGSEVVSRELLNTGVIELTVGVNGYDDGASTGEVRRALGDFLGPSDFRKNASRLASVLKSCDASLSELLETRTPPDRSTSETVLRALATNRELDSDSAPGRLAELWARLSAPDRGRIATAVEAFTAAAPGFDSTDCAVGNVVFGGCFLATSRDFNRALVEYNRLVGLPDDVIVNVTDGTNAFLVAIDTSGKLVSSEADIVDPKRSGGIREIFLIDRWLSREEGERLRSADESEVNAFLAEHSMTPGPNQSFLQRLREADLIVSAPGTQHSSLYPSYMVPGVAEAIAGNLTAIKLLITNILQDAEITDQSAVGLVERALYYLRRKGQSRLPGPSLITHYLMNDPERVEGDEPYVPLGRLESIEDPRLVRIGNFQDPQSGRHNAAAVLEPFLATLAQRGTRPSVAVVLLETDSVTLLSQTLVEMARGGAAERVDYSVVCEVDGELDAAFLAELPVKVVALGPGELPRYDFSSFDYVLLFDSSGMYRGEDVLHVLSMLSSGTADAVWGSRRLSLSDIRESYRVRYDRNRLLGAVSYVGSHMLSLSYLLLYGRYVSDTLSGVRAIRSRYLSQADLRSPMMNHQLLATVLAEGGGVFETPVLFFPLPPARVRRTGVLDGLRSLVTILGRRLSPRTHRGADGSRTDGPGR